MTGLALLKAGLLLGLFVLLAGCYGVLYGIGRLLQRRAPMTGGFLCYGLQCAVAATVVAHTPLTDFWKAFIAASAAAYFFIPPITWRFLERNH
jgi:hypothetical protein